jgi:ABC-type nickel/cobalt efflux system permease component RcnA
MHSHLPPGADGKTVTWKNLLLFGISAGLLPCPSALVLMLSAIALNRTALGLVLIVFFSAGLAGTLTLVGLLLVYARDRFTRLKVGRATTLVRLLPIVSAALVAILGFAITYEGLLQTGLLR